MVVYIRADASQQMGSGHVMRCLTLALKLREMGARVNFICRAHTGHLIDYIKNHGFDIHSLPIGSQRQAPNSLDLPPHLGWLGVSWEEDAQQCCEILKKEQVEWLVVDHYAIDARWEKALGPYTRRIMVIDDLADRPHQCDLLLDQNYTTNMGERYRELIPIESRPLLGPRYALLRNEFFQARKNLLERTGYIKRIIVFFGGSDLGNQTAKALEALDMLYRPDIIVDVVVGASNPNKDYIRMLCVKKDNVNFYCQVEYMASLMVSADLLLGAGGANLWERCILALPSISLILADNQREVTHAVAAMGATWNLGWGDEVNTYDINKALTRALKHPNELALMGQRAAGLMGDTTLCGTDLVAKALEWD